MWELFSLRQDLSQVCLDFRELFVYELVHFFIFFFCEKFFITALQGRTCEISIARTEIWFVSMACHMHILPFWSAVVFSPLFTSALNSIFCKWDLPVFTLPFNMVLSMYLSATGCYSPFFPSKVIKPVSSVPNVTWPDLSGLEVRYTVSSHFLQALEDTQCPPGHQSLAETQL